MRKVRISFCLFYFVLSSYLFWEAMRWRDDGSSWFGVFYVSWPVCYISAAGKSLLYSVFPRMGEWPNPDHSILRWYEGVSSVIGGTIWYWVLFEVLIRIKAWRSKV